MPPIASGTRCRHNILTPSLLLSTIPISLRHPSSDLSHYQSHYQSHTIRAPSATHYDSHPFCPPHPLPTQEGRIANHLIPVDLTKKPTRNKASTVKINFFTRTPKAPVSITCFCQTQRVRSCKPHESA